MEIIPILFLSFTLASGVILPFLFGSSFASLFATTIMIALFTYYEFTTLLLTKKDPLTGLLNRQAYYADSAKDKDSITALISIDMNGLKSINDNQGHTAGDKAIATLAECLQKAAKRRQSCYRVGGDEFLVLCRKNTLEEVQGYIERVRRLVNETPYSCSIGYSYSANHDKSIDALIRESDEMMYLDKQRHYETSGIDRRKR